MAARPNTLRTLEYGQKLVANQLTRLNDMIAMAEKVLAENKTLTPGDIANYKACIATGRKQITQLTKLSEIPIPTAAPVAPRKRGRPSREELEQLAVARGEKKPAKAAAPVATVTPIADAPKKRGRKSKAEIAAAEAAALAAAAPKRRGRPPKAQAPVAVTAAPVAATPAEPAKKRGRPPKAKVQAAPPVVITGEAPKRRGRPPKAAVAVEAAAQTQQVVEATDAPVKRGPGRPKGSKNKPVMNGQNTDVQAA